MSKPPEISQRKADHLNLCTDGDVAFRTKTNLFEQVQLVHDALPELSLDDINVSTSFAGKPLAAPLIIAAMTGGVDAAEQINSDLASVAEELEIGFAFGSQRPLLTDGIRTGYLVRNVAPTTLILGNIGVVQAAQSTTAEVEDLIALCGVDALCVHLNPAMEIVQPEGDRDFRGGLDAIARLVDGLSVPVVVKETGCGLSRAVGQRLVAAGVKWVDTSGAGGTSWVAVEQHRADDAHKPLAETYREWGIPTAASVAHLSALPLGICATGGINDGQQIAKAIALGATCGGIARPILQTHAKGGRAAVSAYVQRIISEIKVACLLCGADSLNALRKKPVIIGDSLAKWIDQANSRATPV